MCYIFAGEDTLWLQLYMAKHSARKLRYNKTWKDTFAIQENIRQAPSTTLTFPGFVSDFMSVHLMHDTLSVICFALQPCQTHAWKLTCRYQRWYRANAQLRAFVPTPKDDRVRRIVCDANLCTGRDCLRRAAVPLMISHAIDAWPAMSKLPCACGRCIGAISPN